MIKFRTLVAFLIAIITVVFTEIAPMGLQILSHTLQTVFIVLSVFSLLQFRLA